MQRPHVFAALIAACLVFAATADRASGAPSSSDLATAGRAFALKVCWACHIVAENQTQTPILSHPAPSFLAIAQRPDLTESSLRQLLASHEEKIGHHAGMPNPRLVDYQIDEVVAYIMSLKK